MSIVTRLILQSFRKRLHQINKFSTQPIETQKEVFLSLIAAGSACEYGKKHHFSDIFTIEQYQQNVPIVDYQMLWPYIERMLKGEQQVLWNTPIKWFAKSSGTTGSKSKFIPVSAECMQECHYKGMKDVMAIYLANHPKSKLHSGRSLTLGGSHQLSANASGIRFGDLSALLIENTPLYVELLRLPSRRVALMSNFTDKIAAIAREASSKNIVSFSGVPSWNLVLMKHILEYTGKNNLLEVWPNLEVFFHGGVAFGPYKEQFNQLIPHENMHYMETYNASEGFFAIQNDPNDDAMLLILDNAVFYEFIKTDELDQDQPRAYTIADVVLGVNYAMVVSTNAGLWRYMIGDTIKFTSLLPYKIRITGRTAHFINAFGEELIADNAEVALRKTCNKTGTIVSEYTVAPIYMGDNAKGAHEWLIEFEKPPANLDFFADLLDRAICEQNSDYEAKRINNATLTRLKIQALRKGTFYEWMQSKEKLGGQNKIPRLFNSREYVEQLLRINNTREKLNNE